MSDKKQQLVKKIERRMQKLSKLPFIIKGTLNKITSKNAKGETKEKFQLTYKAEKNITKTVYIKKDKVEETNAYIANYKESKKIINEIILLNIELLKSG